MRCQQTSKRSVDGSWSSLSRTTDQIDVLTETFPRSESRQSSAPCDIPHFRENARPLALPTSPWRTVHCRLEVSITRFGPVTAILLAVFTKRRDDRGSVLTPCWPHQHPNICQAIHRQERKGQCWITTLRNTLHRGPEMSPGVVRSLPVSMPQHKTNARVRRYPLPHFRFAAASRPIV
jgi:hypothetical protein